jgi:hypothetical protein
MRRCAKIQPVLAISQCNLGCARPTLMQHKRVTIDTARWKCHRERCKLLCAPPASRGIDVICKESVSSTRSLAGVYPCDCRCGRQLKLLSEAAVRSDTKLQTSSLSLFRSWHLGTKPCTTSGKLQPWFLHICGRFTNRLYNRVFPAVSLYIAFGAMVSMSGLPM